MRDSKYHCVTQPSENSPRSHLKSQYSKFAQRLELQINRNFLVKKNEIIRGTAEHRERLGQIKMSSDQLKAKLAKHDHLFDVSFQQPIKKDIHKWEDYQKFFAKHFEKLEEQVRAQQQRNKQAQQLVKERRKVLYEVMRRHIKGKEGEEESTAANTKRGASTKESTVRLSYSLSMRSHRLQTESSLPSIRQQPTLVRIKTLPSEVDSPIADSPAGEARRKAFSYMDRIGTVKQRQNSQCGKLLDWLGWYRGQKVNLDDDWFLAVLFKDRHFNKLKQYLLVRSGQRKVKRHKTALME